MTGKVKTSISKRNIIHTKKRPWWIDRNKSAQEHTRLPHATCHIVKMNSFHFRQTLFSTAHHKLTVDEKMERNCHLMMTVITFLCHISDGSDGGDDVEDSRVFSTFVCVSRSSNIYRLLCFNNSNNKKIKKNIITQSISLAALCSRRIYLCHG